MECYVGDSDCPNILTDNFLNKLTGIYNSSFPIKVKNVGKKRICNPWLSKAILKSIRIKHYKYKLTLNNQLSINSYKNYCKLLSKIIRASKKLYFSKLFNKHKNDLKYTWTLLNRLINSKINIHNLIELEVNNKIISNNLLHTAK